MHLDLSALPTQTTAHASHSVRGQLHLLFSSTPTRRWSKVLPSACVTFFVQRNERRSTCFLALLFVDSANDFVSYFFLDSDVKVAGEADA